MAKRQDGRRWCDRGARWVLLATVIASVVGPSGVIAREVPFGVEQPLVTSMTGATATAIGDINGDGLPDIVGGGSNSGQFGITWHRNNGRNPAAFSRFLVTQGGVRGFGVQDIAVGDMDGDDREDIVTFNLTAGLLVYYNLGGDPIRWRLAFVGSTFGEGGSIRLIDLDEDDDLDVISCNPNTRIVQWFQNEGAFFQPRSISSDSSTVCYSLDLADVDGNGTLDVVTAGGTNDEVAWHGHDGDPTGTWTKNEIQSEPVGGEGDMRAVAAADFDGDGDVDVLSGSEQAGGRIRFHESDGQTPPTFTTRTLFEGAQFEIPGLRRFVRFDPDGDGDVDVAFSAFDNSHFGWLDNDGAMPSSFALRTLDIDPDGPYEFISEPDPTQPFGLRVWISDGILTGRVYGVYGLAAADLDGDGDDDLISASQSDAKLAWHENRSCEEVFPFQPPVAEGSGFVGAASVATGDMNGDGAVDVVSASSVSNTVAWHENDGEMFPSFTATTVTSAASDAQSVKLFDVDQDGDLDILLAAARARLIAWYESSGGASPEFEEHILSDQALGARDVAAGDLDGDGDTDFVTATSADNAITLWLNVGDEDEEAYTATPLTRTGRAPWAVELADIDGDGDLDILYAAISNGRIAWLRNADLEFDEFPIAVGIDEQQTDATGIAAAAIDITVGDFDDDGRLDVASVSAHDDKVAWYRNNGGASDQTFLASEIVLSEDPDGPLQIQVTSYDPGTGEFTVSIVGEANGPADGPSGVTAVDLDGDGDTDLVMASAIDNSIGWYENDGLSESPRFLYRGVDRDGGGARSVAVADLNGDDRPDLVAGLYQDSTVAWYLGADDDACVAFDVDGDGNIDAAELVMMGRAFGLDVSLQDGTEPGWWSSVDLNDDGRIDGQDLSALGASGVWGKSVFSCSLTCPAAAD